ncbi:hypothetical protein SHIRM173S_01105 [Streptomyces hirsutus]
MSESSVEAVNAAVTTAAASVAEASNGWRRATGIAGVAIGVLATGAAAGVAIERMTVGRGMRMKARLALDSTGPYGSLRGTPGKAYAEDGTELYYEVDDPDPDPDAEPARRRRLFGRKPPAPVTVVFSHGYCLGQDSWHFQRAALRGVVRAVYWDQRSHGRSGGARPRSSGASRSPSTSWAGPQGRHRRRRARGADRAGRALHGRDDGDGPRRPVPRADP